MMEGWNIGIMGWRPSGRYTPAAGKATKYLMLYNLLEFAYRRGIEAFNRLFNLLT